MAASTTDTYEQTWEPSFTAIGFNNRLFLCPGTGRKRFSLPTKIPESEKRLLRDRLGQVLQKIGDYLEMRIDPQAADVYHQWYMGLENSVHTKRLDVCATRLMPLLAVNRGKHEIDMETIQQTIDLCNWQLNVRRIHDPIDAENVVSKMEEKIRRVLAAKGPLKERDLKRAVHYNRVGVWVFNHAIKNLSDGRDKEIVFNGKSQTWRLT